MRLTAGCLRGTRSRRVGQVVTGALSVDPAGSSHMGGSKQAPSAGQGADGQGALDNALREMVERTNAHDLEGMAVLIHQDYQSEQPFHPARGFGGRAQMKANWGSILTGVPDLRAEVPASVRDGDVVWSEWHWWGTTEKREPFEMRAITQFTVRDGLVVSGRLFAELVEQGGLDINDSVEASSGRRPREG